MKKLMIALGMVAMFSGCSRIGPGHVGIKVNMAGTDKGVEAYPAQTGWVFYNPMNTNIYEYPTFVQTIQWTKNPEEGSPQNEEISFNTKDGMVMTADISLSYSLDPAKVPAFYVKFRTDDLKTFTYGFMHNVARDAFGEIASHYSVEEVYGAKKEAYITDVRARIQSNVEQFGVKLEQFGFIGAPRPPDNVVESINSKIKATQDAMKAENEVRTVEAEAHKTIVKAEGEAKANRELAGSISDALIKWKSLELTKQALEKWNGVRPMVEGSGSGLLLNINPK